MGTTLKLNKPSKLLSLYNSVESSAELWFLKLATAHNKFGLPLHNSWVTLFCHKFHLFCACSKVECNENSVAYTSCELTHEMIDLKIKIRNVETIVTDIY
jgi:hypothetical protein